MPFEPNPDFELTEGDDRKIWRYMDFTKYVSLLDTHALYFALASQLADRFEGSFPGGNLALREKFRDDAATREYVRQRREASEVALKCVHVNCWYMDDDESAAMWEMYARSGAGIAIQSTVGRLKRSFRASPRMVHIGVVRYIDYRHDWISETNVYFPFLHKRRSFEYERELRAIIWDAEGFEAPKGLYELCDLGTLIETMYVSPTAPSWFTGLVRSVSQRYGASGEIRQSSLQDDPVY